MDLTREAQDSLKRLFAEAAHKDDRLCCTLIRTDRELRARETSIPHDCDMIWGLGFRV